MVRSVLLLLFIWLIAIVLASKHENFLTQNYVDTLNSIQSSWVAIKNFQNDQKMLGAVRKLVSTVPRDKTFLNSYPVRFLNDNDTVIPTKFDAREQWPNCTTIGLVWDQGVCSSGWAVSAASAIADRICIKSNQTINPVLSPEDLLSCCKDCRFGCDGGYPSYAWQHMNTSGIVTGGPYQSHTGCKSYSIQPCGHFNESSQTFMCSDVDPGCISTCYKSCDAAFTSRNANATYEDNLYFTEEGYTISPEEKQIKLEIMTHGPVQATFDILDDFSNYNNGVYVPSKNSSFVGEQSVKLIGWGVDEKNQSYWLGVNSWNTEWGDGGFFKSLINSTRATMESEVYAAIPILKPNEKPANGAGGYARGIGILSFSLLYVLLYISM